PLSETIGTGSFRHVTKTKNRRSTLTEYQRVDPAQELEALRRQVERLTILASDDSSLLLTTLLEHSPHGIVVCDDAGRLTLHNRAAELIWAGSATTSDLTDWSRYRAFHPHGEPYGVDDWGMARSLKHGQTVVAEEIHIERFDGTHALLLGSSAPIRDSKGR